MNNVEVQIELKKKNKKQVHIFENIRVAQLTQRLKLLINIPLEYGGA